MRRSRPLAIAVLVAAAGLVSPASALAASCTGRPGSSAVDQYCEAIPSASGSQLSKKDATGSTKTGGRVAPSTTSKLEGAGADGAAVLQLAGSQASKPQPKQASPQKSSTGKSTQAGAATPSATGKSAQAGAATPSATGESSQAGAATPSATRSEAAPAKRQSGSVLKAVEASATSGPAAGGALVWILLATTLAVVGGAWLSFRRRHDERPSRYDSGPQ